MNGWLHKAYYVYLKINICNLHADPKKDKNSDDNKDQVKDDLTKEKSNDSTDEIENNDFTNQEEDNLKIDDSTEKKGNNLNLEVPHSLHIHKMHGKFGKYPVYAQRLRSIQSPMSLGMPLIYFEAS